MPQVWLLFSFVLISTCFGYVGYAQSSRLSGVKRLNSRPVYHGFFVALSAFIPSFFLFVAISIGDGLFIRQAIFEYYPVELSASEDFNEIIAFSQVKNYVSGVIFEDTEEWVKNAGSAWQQWDNQIRNISSVVILCLTFMTGFFALRKIGADFTSRSYVEKIITWFLAICSLIAILTTVGIIFSVIFESFRFFALVPVSEFLFGLTWNPQFDGAERAGSGQMGLATYGSVPLFLGTLLISVIALSVAVPVGLFSAIYLSEYATQRTRSIVKPLMEILAGIPTVVYGFFAALTVAPFVRGLGMDLGLDVASESALAAGLVMGIMIIPFVSSLSDDVINAVPQSLRDASFALGSTKSESVKQVVLPAALSGIVASVLLAVSRAVGETMIVVMAAGLAANLSVNPLDAVTTVTSQIVTILVGDQEFESAKTLSAFALALTLIIITLVLNFSALQIVKKYREHYE